MEEKIILLKKWKKRIKKAQKAHYDDAHRLARNRKILGVPTVILTTLVGTAIFANLKNSHTEDEVYTYYIILGLLSISASILASLQTFLNYSEKSEKHLNAARRLSSLKKEIQHNVITLNESPERINEFLNYIREKWDEIINEAPLVSNKNAILFYKNKKKKKLSKN